MSGRKFILIDTNIILRLLIGDIPLQVEKSRRLFKEIEEEKTKGLISILVINELLWILEHFYEKNRQEFMPQILKLISLRNIKILEMKKQELIAVLEKMQKTTLDFTDIYLLSFSEKSKNAIATFDKEILNKKIKRQLV